MKLVNLYIRPSQYYGKIRRRKKKLEEVLAEILYLILLSNFSARIKSFFLLKNNKIFNIEEYRKTSELKISFFFQAGGEVKHTTHNQTKP